MVLLQVTKELGNSGAKGGEGAFLRWAYGDCNIWRASHLCSFMLKSYYNKHPSVDMINYDDATSQIGDRHPWHKTIKH